MKTVLSDRGKSRRFRLVSVLLIFSAFIFSSP